MSAPSLTTQTPAKKAPISITKSAVTHIKELLAKRDKPSCGIALKIVTRGCSGYSYKIEYADKPPLGAIPVSQDGITVFVDSKGLLYLIGTTMDFIDSKLERGFKFINPNEDGRCGCGESFHLKN
ncbi:MAG: iron-sulfur cluster assembly accessory protein [Pseudomonadota bacterium]